jgi:hypothetical protein
MENKGLLFIPDISGFSRFVSQTEIEHSRLIIQELLEIIINANEIGLEVSEVEGDAILFYKFGECPGLEDLYKQVSKMFCEFHRSLIAYDHRRFCQCKACTSTIDLTLKVITHYGEFTGYNVKNFNKLIGRDIIVAHQLLKNDIDQHEYWLVTKNLLRDDEPAGFAQWMKWKSSVKQTEDGEISFHYTQLGELKNELTPETFTQPGFSDKVKVISVSDEYDTDIITLFHATGDYNFRDRWQEGVKSVEVINHFLPRLGMRCRCIMDNGETVIFSTNYSYHPERIEFSEAEEKNKTSTSYLLEKTGDDKTKLTVDYYITKGVLAKTIFNLVRKKKTENAFEKSLANLKELVKEIHLPG